MYVCRYVGMRAVKDYVFRMDKMKQLTPRQGHQAGKRSTYSIFLFSIVSYPCITEADGKTRVMNRTNQRAKPTRRQE